MRFLETGPGSWTVCHPTLVEHSKCRILGPGHPVVLAFSSSRYLPALRLPRRYFLSFRPPLTLLYPRRHTPWSLTRRLACPTISGPRPCGPQWHRRCAKPLPRTEVTVSRWSGSRVLVAGFVGWKIVLLNVSMQAAACWDTYSGPYRCLQCVCPGIRTY